jgi:xanthine dehydrogenase YagR molybdenum-binding subunit
MKVESNGESREIDDGDGTAVKLVRDELGLTGTKLVCGGGVCGACTVHLDGRPGGVLPAAHRRPGRARAHHRRRGVAGSPVPAGDGGVRRHAVRFCTPGFVMACSAFHDRWRAERGVERPTREQVTAALSGHLCRCGAYEGIIAALQGACAGEFDEPGGPSPRLEATGKVTGAASYTVDVRVPGMLHGVIVRSGRAHAQRRCGCRRWSRC